MRGYHHSTEHFGTVDGPGIRYVLFLSGCRLRCGFCHNPDTWRRGDKSMTVTEVMEDMARNRQYYEASNGGITVSGGEPLLQADFVTELFQACRKQGVHTLLDTSGYASRHKIEKVLPTVDAISYSIKAVDPGKHQRLTGACNARIITNLAYVAARCPTVIRYVLIPGVTDEDQDLALLAELVHSLPGEVPVEILGYHTLGQKKWRQLGIEYPLLGIEAAREEDLRKAQDQLKRRGVILPCEN